MKKHTHITFSQVTAFVWKYVRRKPVALILITVGLLLQMLTEIAMPYYIGKFVDYLSVPSTNPEESFFQALKYIAILAFTGITFWILHVGINLYKDKQLILYVMRETAQDAFHKVLQLETEWHVNSFAGATVRKISRGMWAVDQFIESMSLKFIPLIMLMIGIIWIVCIRWTSMGLLIGGGIVIYTIISIWIATKWIAPKARIAAEKDTKLGGTLADSLGCNHTVKSFAKEKEEEALFAKHVQEWESARWRSWTIMNIGGFGQNMLMTILKMSMFVLVAWLWSQGKATVGDVAFIIGIYNLVSSHLRHIGDNIRNLQQAANDAEDIVEFSLLPVKVADIPHAKTLKVKQASIDFKNVTFAYEKSKKTLFKDFNLSIAPGEKVALVGHSGGGKTTITKIIQRMYNISSGLITISDQNINNVTQESLRNHIALIPQEPLLFHRSLLANIRYGNPKASCKEVEKASKLAHAHEFISKLPKGYETLVGERGIKLSGGERQRVAIARAILANCPILILDEATSSLDSESEKLIQDALHNLWKDKTAIIIAHRLSTIKMVDRILVLENGKIVEEGTHASLLKKNSGIYKRLYKLQAEGFLH